MRYTYQNMCIGKWARNLAQFSKAPLGKCIFLFFGIFAARFTSLNNFLGFFYVFYDFFGIFDIRDKIRFKFDESMTNNRWGIIHRSFPKA